MESSTSNLSEIELSEKISDELSKLLSDSLQLSNIDINSIVLIDANKETHLLQIAGKDRLDIGLYIDQYERAYKSSAISFCTYYYEVVPVGGDCMIKRTNALTKKAIYIKEKSVNETNNTISRYHAVKVGSTCWVYREVKVSGNVESDDPFLKEGEVYGPSIEKCTKES